MNLNHFKTNIKSFSNLSKKSRFLIIGCIILPIILVASQICLTIIYNESIYINTIVINILGLILLFFLIFYTIINLLKLERTTRNLEEAELYNKTLRILHDNLRAFKHDFSNIVHAIGGYIDTSDIDGLKKYYSQLLEDCTSMNNLSALNPSVINNSGIYNVIATKYYLADKSDIKFNLEVFLDLNEIDKDMKIYEFTRILGILLDNAIEAAKDCENKIINLIMRKEESKHRIVMIIENTYMNKDVNTDEIFQKGYSSKEGNTGLGLWEVRQILNKNKNLNLFTTKNEEFFKQQFEIYY